MMKNKVYVDQQQSVLSPYLFSNSCKCTKYIPEVYNNKSVCQRVKTGLKIRETRKKLKPFFNPVPETRKKFKLFFTPYPESKKKNETPFFTRTRNLANIETVFKPITRNY